jgi:hypothetical protein
MAEFIERYEDLGLQNLNRNNPRIFYIDIEVLCSMIGRRQWALGRHRREVRNEFHAEEKEREIGPVFE